jgi:hypothetical protein
MADGIVPHPILTVEDRASEGKRRLLIAVAVMAIIALRKYDSVTHPQFWAEDGAMFFIEAERTTHWLLLSPYQGYLHLIPRFIAVLGRNIPLIWAPALYTWAPLLFTGALAWGIQSPRVPLPGKAAAALAVALVPHTGEVYFTTCNLQWILAIGLFALAIIDDPSSWPQRFGDILSLAVLGLTGPFIAPALPLFAWRAWRLRSAWSASMALLAAGCLAVQAPAMIAFRPIPHSEPLLILHGAAVIAQRMILSVVADHIRFPEALCAATFFVVPGALAWILWRRRPRLTGGLELMMAGALTMAASMYKMRFDTWNLDDLYNGDRYMFMQKVLLVWLVAAIASTCGVAVRRVLAVAAVSAFLISAPRFVFPPYPDLHWASYAKAIDRGETVTVPIIPAGSKFTYRGGLPPHQ